MENKVKTSANLADRKRFYLCIVKISELIDQRQKGLLESHDLTHPQYNVLRILNGAWPEALSLKEIQNRMVFGSPDITRMIDRLISKNLVLRKTNELDKRKIDIQLSDHGEEVLKELNPKMEATVFNFFEGLIDQNELEVVNTALEKVKTALLD